MKSHSTGHNQLIKKNVILRQQFLRIKRLTNSGLLLWDIKKDKVTFSGELSGVLGLRPRKTMTHKDFLKLVHKDDKAQVKCIFSELLKGKKRSSSCFRLMRQDGAERIINAEFEPVKDASGKTTHFYAFLQDITVEKCFEQALIETDQKAHPLIEKSLDAIIVSDTATQKIVYANPAALKLFGYSLEEIKKLKTKYLVLASERDKHLASYKKFIARGNVKGVERTIITKNGVKIPANVSAFLYEAGGKRFAVAELRDVTEQVNTRTALEQKAKELKTLNRELHRLTVKITQIDERDRKKFAEILHESISQNLTALNMALEGFLGKHCKKCCENKTLQDEKKQLLDILNSTIEATRNVSASIYPVSLREMKFEEAVKWHLNSIKRHKDIKVSLKLCPIAKKLKGKENLQKTLFLIIRESFQNILKHSRATEASINLKRLDGIHRLSIKDNGVGFSLSDTETMQDRGLGLILMREWAKSINGNMRISSKRDSGTELIFKFPI